MGKTAPFENCMDTGKFPRSRTRAFCFACERPVTLLSADSVGELLGIPAADIASGVKRELVHTLHNSRGEIRYCENSAVEEFEKMITRTLEPTEVEGIVPIC